MKNEVKNFWSERADKHMWKGELGKWQTTSLTQSEDEARKRRRDELRHLKEALTLIEGAESMKLLDVGCGTGRLTIFLAENFEHVYATDYTREFLAVAKQEAETLRIGNITFKHQNADESNDDIEFDCCSFCGILQYLTDEEYERALERTKSAKFFIVKESVGVDKRIELEDHYSEELGTNYSAIYRNKDQIIKDFESLGFGTIMDELVAEHREETNMRIFVFKKK